MESPGVRNLFKGTRGAGFGASHLGFESVREWCSLGECWGLFVVGSLGFVFIGRFVSD